MIGDRLLHYEITGKLGEGGMGEVYRATDTRLNRDVAIKVLPEAFTQDEERLARFEREAQVLAALNHQRIAAIYGLEESGDQRFLVLELVEGPTLAERLDAGPVSVEQSIEIGLQMAEGLESAHEAGIVHRDLKPANVKLTADNHVKILDFGLAKAWESPAGDSNLTQSPTLTAQMTQEGVILGTAAYMSPEQARAQEADKRSDIWSFGVILWEMLTGRRLFQGATVSDILASVLKEAPDLNALPAETPEVLRALLGRCLRRDPLQRLRDIGEARVALSQPVDPASAESAATAVSGRKVSWAWAMGGLVLGVAAMAILAGREPVAPVEATRASISLTPAARLDLGSVFLRETIAISPDGRRIAFVGLDRDGTEGVRQLWIRELADAAARVVPDSDRAEGPFYSPDGSWLAFLQNGEIMRVATAGGAVQPLSLPSGAWVSSASWAADGRIVAVGEKSEETGMLFFWEVDPDTGTLTELHRFDGDELDNARKWVQLLPDRQGILYSSLNIDAPEMANLMFLDLESGEESIVQAGGLRPRLLPSGDLLYSNGGRLYSAPFDVETRRLTSPPQVVLDGLAVSPLAGNSWYEVSANGTLVSVPAEAIQGEINSMLRVGTDGSSQIIEGRARYFVDPRVSPDGARLAFSVPHGGNDIWVHDFERDTQTRLSSEPGEDETPIWSPSGEWLAWAAAREGKQRALVRRRPDGSGAIESLWSSDRHFHASDWGPDGEFLLVDVVGDTGFDIWQVPVGEPEAARPLLAERHHELHARLSPDGRWLSYTSNETGSDEVYLQAFPALDRKVQVSARGGYQAVWQPGGSTLFFRSQEGTWAVSIESEVDLKLSTPELLFPRKYAYGKGYAHFGYDAAPDGTFIMSASDTSFLPRSLDLFLGWSHTLKRPSPRGP